MWNKQFSTSLTYFKLTNKFGNLNHCLIKHNSSHYHCSKRVEIACLKPYVAHETCLPACIFYISNKITVHRLGKPHCRHWRTKRLKRWQLFRSSESGGTSSSRCNVNCVITLNLCPKGQIMHLLDIVLESLLIFSPLK